jgi:hypothetical protein
LILITCDHTPEPKKTQNVWVKPQNPNPKNPKDLGKNSYPKPNNYKFFDRSHFILKSGGISKKFET